MEKKESQSQSDNTGSGEVLEAMRRIERELVLLREREMFPVSRDEAIIAAGGALVRIALERDLALKERDDARGALASLVASALAQLDRLQAKIKSMEKELHKEAAVDAPGEITALTEKG